MTQQTVLNTVKDSLIGLLHAAVFLPVLNFGFQLNRVPGIRELILFFFLSQVLAVVFHKSWLYFLNQTILGLVFLYFLFRDSLASTWPLSWVRESVALLREQASLLFAGQLIETPQFLLITLFFIIISLLTYLAVHKHLAFPSFLSAFVYLLLVHTFSANTVLPEMIQLIGFGFLFLSVTHMTSQTTFLQFFRNVSLTALVTLALTSLSSWGIEHWRPTQEWVEGHSTSYQRRLDEQGFFDWINNYTSGIGYRRTGMGFDDSELGGPLRQDYTRLFRAYTAAPHYWKVLHRTEYNGLGWESDEVREQAEFISTPFNIAYDYTMTPEDRNLLRSSETVSTIGIEWMDELGYIAYPYGWYDLDSTNVASEYSIERDMESGLYTIVTDTDDLFAYSVSYDKSFPTRFDDNLLQIDDGWRDYYNTAYREMMEDADDGYDDAVSGIEIWFEDELQLTDALPNRVSDLAHELTEGLTGEYEKVRAIEQYLKEDGGYRYSLLEVDNTPDGGDYVDHFLFESRIGYCNNFSSAMAIMLRAIDIPARWTKGFTPGSQYTDDDSETFFEVSNANAHSWVEVYFPSYGWVPFEPSPSFANPMTNLEPVATVVGETYSFESDDFVDLEGEDSAPESSDSESEPLEADSTSERSVDDLLEENSFGDATVGNGMADNRSLLFKLSIVAAISLIILLAIFRWKIAVKVIEFLITKNQLTLNRSSSLVLRLYHFKMKRQPGQTVEDYLYQWKPFIPEGSNDALTINRFVNLADKAFYGPQNNTQKPDASEKRILVDSLDLLDTLPDLKKNPRTPHPLSGKIQKKL